LEEKEKGVTPTLILPPPLCRGGGYRRGYQKGENKRRGRSG